MDIVINELSMDGQFEYEDFINYLKDHLIPILGVATEIGMSLFKKSDIYSCKITPEKTLHDFMVLRGEPAVTKMKSQLVSIYRDEPFWDLTPATDINCDYNSESFKIIPNGITEAYERDSFLISFTNVHFHTEVVSFYKNSSRCDVSNFCFFHKFQSSLQQIGVIEYWYKNSFEVVLGYFFEIRFKESNHNKAHFHVRKGDCNGSYSIPEFEKIVGNIPNDDEREIKSWAHNNASHIVEMWNRLHLNLQI